MQYIDSIIIHNFKSFKHANIKFSNGFNCIVGANGSGKSNLCDSLLFALGESSLKRMRVNNTALLINSFAKPKNDDGVKRAYVKINFGGDNPLEVTRIIKSNNKIAYKLDGKRVKRQDLIDVLRAHKSEINDTNIIAQGEISAMVNLNPRERRELIDVAAGIKEFNDKKDTSMKELQKVEEKVNEAQIVLGERKGFLDQLEKEKEDAERYLQLTEMIKRISYTTLKNSERQAESDFDSMADNVQNADQKKKDVNAGMTDITLMIEKLSKDREALSKSLNERSVELSSTNKILEGINKELAVKETEARSLKERMDESESQITQYKKEKKKLEEESAISTKSIDSTTKELGEKAKILGTKEISEENAGSSQINTIGKNQKRIDELYKQEESISKQFLQNKFEIEDIQKSIKSAEQKIEAKSAEYDKQLDIIKQHKEKLSNLDEKISSANKDLEFISTDIQKCRKSIDDNYVEMVNLRERIAVSGGGSDRSNELLKKNIAKGFYGRAYELCTYESKYDLAINAAASSRLSYFVVESAEVADSAIKLIKSKQMGRASFIPLKDLIISQREDTSKLDKLIDHVEFDKKFDRAFSYIFSNTYVVDSIAEAKSIGFGKGRFVTLEGELVEQSGIISGGSAKNFQNPSQLESKLRALEEQQKSLNAEMGVISSESEKKRKEVASYQTESMNCKYELKHAESESMIIKPELDSSKATIKELTARLSQRSSNATNMDSKREQLLKELNAVKEENEKIYASNLSDPSKPKEKMNKSEIEKLKALRAEVENLKITAATISKEQEMRSARAQEIENDIETKTEEGKETRKKMALLDNDIIELGKHRSELQQKMGKSDATSQDLYKRIQEMDSKLSKLANDRGKMQSDLEKVNRDIIEQETRKVQLQTRINDIKAELLSYQNVEMIEKATLSELEAKKTIAKNDLDRMGAVNLKAPEVYESKKKDVDEAKSKLSVLANERDSIIAMINEIESKKLNIFNETLGDVNENFSKLYSYIFPGSSRLQLDNQKDPFNSGLSVVINSPKNKNSTIESLSGGEKILVMMMLIFAIQAHDPMSFYIFDEIDISLDKENSKKLSKLMKEISKKSQVIVISHNDSLITATDTAIGVVSRNNESKVVGLQLTPTENVAII